MNFTLKPDGARSIYAAQCSDRLSVTLKFSLRKHPFDFESGDAMGYGLFASIGSDERPLYNDGFPLNSMASYVGWKFVDGRYTGPAPTYNFAPLPEGRSTSTVRVFKKPERVYDRNRPPWRADNPPLMNIFVDPDTMSQADFNDLADCLGKNETALDDTLRGIENRLPQRDRRFYFPLLLGGIVYGLPPYGDPAYLTTIASVWGGGLGDKNIPDHGRFTLYPGQSARGSINGRNVIVSVDANGTAQGAVSVPGPICSTDLAHCGKSIVPSGQSDDGSVTFVIELKIGENVGAEELPLTKPWKTH